MWLIIQNISRKCGFLVDFMGKLDYKLQFIDSFNFPPKNDKLDKDVALK